MKNTQILPMKSGEVTIRRTKIGSSQTRQFENIKIGVPCIFFQKSFARACIYEKKVVPLCANLRSMRFCGGMKGLVDEWMRGLVDEGKLLKNDIKHGTFFFYTRDCH